MTVTVGPLKMYDFKRATGFIISEKSEKIIKYPTNSKMPDR